MIAPCRRVLRVRLNRFLLETALALILLNPFDCRTFTLGGDAGMTIDFQNLYSSLIVLLVIHSL